ncbi:MAG: hypothetical protein IPG78_09785 [Ignavibacteria bacterium]|nr:hypothetical protein [Ignavibacteria bacterium]
MTVTETVTGTFTVKVTETVTVTWNCVRDQDTQPVTSTATSTVREAVFVELKFCK